MATAFHGDEPPRRLINRLSYCQQTMIAKDDGFAVAQRFGYAPALSRIVDDSSEIMKNRVVFIEGTGVLCDGVEQASERRPGLAVKRMGVGGSNAIRPRCVN